MRVAAVALAAYLIACADTDHVSSLACDLPCYTGPAWTRNVGECRDGVPVCDDDRQVIACAGEVTPTAESCESARDTNCDGVLGVELQPPAYREVCGSNVGACRLGHRTCISGLVLCVGGVSPTPEICNRIDDDCDGETDNLVPYICYDGSPLDLASPISECRAGIAACRDGALACTGQVLPRLEACDSVLDLNCNGRVDSDNDAAPGELTLAFVLDRSCSMADIDTTIRSVMIDLAGLRVAPRYRYSLIDVPGGASSTPAWRLLDVGSVEFVRFLRGHAELAGGDEYQLDALNEIARMGLAPGFAIVFTDEPAQAVRENTLPADVANNLQAAHLEPLIFARLDDRDSFLPMVVQSIYSRADAISRQLDDITNPCR